MIAALRRDARAHNLPNLAVDAELSALSLDELLEDSLDELPKDLLDKEPPDELSEAFICPTNAASAVCVTSAPDSS